MHAPGICPFCEGSLRVEALRCPSCRTRMEGRFDLLPFHRLSEEEVRFLLRFLQHWGNLSRLSREMGVSYPTIRARYRELLGKLGLDVAEEEEMPERAELSSPMEILAALERRELTVDEALKWIRKSSRRTSPRPPEEKGEESPGAF